MAWADGSAIYYISLSNLWFRFPQVEFLHNEILSIYTTYIAIVIQLLFPFLIWFDRTRLFVLIPAFILHASIAIFLSNAVLHFGLVVLIALMVFIQPMTYHKLF